MKNLMFDMLAGDGQDYKTTRGTETMYQTRKFHTLSFIAALAASAVMAGHAFAQSTPGYNNKIPEKIMTPNRVETRIGTLKFFDGWQGVAICSCLYGQGRQLSGRQQVLQAEHSCQCPS
jgi:hypothetical protein